MAWFLLVLPFLILLPASQAAAHDPIFLSDDQTTPDVGPYMPDGSISWALYGQVLRDGDTRGFEFDLREGDELYISLLIPNLEPEVSLPDSSLPIVELETPSGAVEVLEPVMREMFNEPFSGTSYVNLVEVTKPGEAGRYRGTVIGAAPSRFSVAIGLKEVFFTESERSGDRPSSFMEMAAPLNAWYSTPPGAEPAATSDDDEVAIDLEEIDEAMESGIAVDSRGSDDEGDSASLEEEQAAEEAAEAAAEAAEAAVSPADDTTQESSWTSWVAPLVAAVVGLTGLGWFLQRRRVAGR